MKTLSATSRKGNLLPDKSLKLLSIARWVPIFGLLLIGLLGVVLTWSFLSESPAVSDFIRSEYGDAVAVDGELSTMASGLGLLIWLLSISSAAIGLWLAHRLLSDYYFGRIFSLSSARRLRLIGWMVVLVSPLGIICETLGIFLVGWLTDASTKSISISFGHLEVLALAFGLLIVAVGHVMEKAIEIAEENEHFI